MPKPSAEINYVGIRKCGCATSALHDDGEWKKREIDDWIADVEARGMVVEVWDHAKVKAEFGYCAEHKPSVQTTLF